LARLDKLLWRCSRFRILAPNERAGRLSRQKACARSSHVLGGSSAAIRPKRKGKLPVVTVLTIQHNGVTKSTAFAMQPASPCAPGKQARRWNGSRLLQALKRLIQSRACLLFLLLLPQLRLRGPSWSFRCGAKTAHVFPLFFCATQPATMTDHSSSDQTAVHASESQHAGATNVPGPSVAQKGPQNGTGASAAAASADESPAKFISVGSCSFTLVKETEKDGFYMADAKAQPLFTLEGPWEVFDSAIIHDIEHQGLRFLQGRVIFVNEKPHRIICVLRAGDGNDKGHSVLLLDTTDPNSDNPVIKSVASHQGERGAAPAEGAQRHGGGCAAQGRANVEEVDRTA
jgi:hypothetical protein